MKETQEPKPAAESGTGEADCSALLAAYSETCRHIEELERIQAGSKHMVLTIEAKKRADWLIERILALMPNAEHHARPERT